ncbi:hypothetical protein, partial [Halorubrum sp. Atlit-9R]|uniref:hypothetical protein n=1 Tax=Halorubrum sp. Atlit-9R TaxID=2282127 RepID=UPI0013143AD9
STIVLPQQKAAAASVDLGQIIFSLGINGTDKDNNGTIDVESGEIFTYVLNYSFSGIDTGADFNDLAIDFPLPEGVEYVDSFVPSGGTVSLQSGYPQGDVNSGQTLRFSFTDATPPKVGAAYQIQVNARFLSYVTPNITTKAAAYKFSTSQTDAASNS